MPTEDTSFITHPPIRLIALEDIKVGEAQGIEIDIEDNGDKKRLDLIIWHQGNEIRIFKNACPHVGLPLETFPNKFLTADKKHLICSAHAATFDPDGLCIAGPCPGKRLTEYKTTRLDGWLMLG